MNALDALFRDEVDRQAGPLRDALKRCRLAPPDGEAMFCAQALKGAARVVGMPPAERLADALEMLLGAAEAAGSVLSGAQLMAAEHALELIEALAQAGADQADDVADAERVQDVASRLAVVGRRSSGRTVAPRREVPAATLELFSLECEQQAKALTQGLLELESHPDRLALVEPLMRAAHSIKGAARVVGLDSAVALAHAMEDQLDRARKGTLVLGPDLVDALLAACDQFQRVGSSLVKPGSAAAPADSSLLELAERISHLGASGLAQAGAAVPVEAKPLLDPLPGQGQPPPAAADAEAAGPSVDAHAPSAQRAASGEEDRVLRVRVGQISRMLGLAGESIVECDRVRRLSPIVDRLRWDHTRLSDLVDELERRLGSPPRQTPVGQGLNALRATLQDLRVVSREWSDEFAAHARRSEQLAIGMYREASETRMRPLSDGLASFPRLVRDLSRKLDKQAELSVEGAGIRIDRDILERIEAPVNHLLRNALDHGIEPVALRRAHGKPDAAVLAIRAQRIGSSIQLDVSDDGGGIDFDKVRVRVAEQGLAESGAVAQMDQDRLIGFLFLSGFSTAARITELSGRGVGLAVVRSVMRDIGGSVRVTSQRHRGTCVTLQIPVSRAVLRAIVVSIRGEPYGLGLASVARIARVSRSEVHEVDGQPFFVDGGHTVTLVDTGAALGLPAPGEPASDLEVLVLDARPQRLGLVVDELLGQHDLVLRRVDSRLGRISHVSAFAVLPDGRPVVVLDADDLSRTVAGSDGGRRFALTASAAAEGRRLRRILVVDDSPTVRATQRDTLAQAGYEVVTANDGLEGWQLLRQGGFDLLVTDVDMPRLDGIGLVRSVRAESGLAPLPVIIMSYRGSEQDRQAGMAAGADAYLLKANFDDQQLIDIVAQLIGGPVGPLR
ncbi:MAG: response regulator [Rubrivivax sp.]